MDQPRPRGEVFDERLREHEHASQHLTLVDTPFCGLADEEGRFVARYFPAPHHIERDVTLSTEVAPILIEESEAHFEILRHNHNIHVPASFSTPGKDEEGRTTIYSLVEYVEGEGIVPPDEWEKHSPEETHERDALTIAEGLTSYFTWVYTARPAYYLADISGLRQYIVQPDHTVSLVDIDQLMCKRSDPRILLTSVGEIISWTKKVRVEPERQNKILDNLYQLYRLLRAELFQSYAIE